MSKGYAERIIKREREQLVTWLRRQAVSGGLAGPNPFVTLRGVIDAIERGDHAVAEQEAEG
jgi:hypothetical protein